jgi:glycosyltransferase involved in cell wall biosynthesis
MTKRRESIVFIVPGFPTNEEETDCLPAVQDLVKAIAHRNAELEVHVISFQYPFRKGVYTWHGCTVHALAGRNKRFPVRFLTWLQAASEIRRLIRSRRVVALHSLWLAECTYVTSWIARLTGTRHIATICGQDALANNPYLKHLSFERITVTANSERAAHAFYESTGRHVDQVVPTGLDQETLAAARREKSERHIDILGVGSLSPVKDFRSFIEIIGQLAKSYPTLRCLILGEGQERALLDREIKDGSLQHVVQLAGHVRREEVLNTMRRAKILLHTSHYEGQGYVFLEALASGMRVVCREVGYTGTGPGVYHCKSNEEMVDVLKALLAAQLERTEVDVMNIDDTARAFEKIYGIV